MPDKIETFVERLERTVPRREFEVIIRAPETIQLSTEEISHALYELVNQKAEDIAHSLEDAKPHFDVEVGSAYIYKTLTTHERSNEER